jgi:hypothetical protein
MKKENAEIVGKMVSALSKNGSDYALGYIESFLTGVIDEFVTDPIKVEQLRLRMLLIGIEALIDAKK